MTDKPKSSMYLDASSAGLRRRDLIRSGVAGVAGAGVLLAGHTSRAASASASSAPVSPTKIRSELRRTAGDGWRAKVQRGSTMEKFFERVERIDPAKPLPPGRPGVDYTPVITPNNETIPFEIKDGVKIFHLVAEEVEHEFAEGLTCRTWGYNGKTNGPTIEAVEGDRVRIYLTNKLPAPTTVHWHGFVLPHGMDGVSGLEQAPALPGETFKYEFTIRQSGTFMYHSHHDTMTQEGMGLVGMFIVHPRRELYSRRELGPEVDRDFAIMLQTWSVDAGARRPNPFSMMFNLFTMNAHVMPATEPLIARVGQRIRIRFGNLSAVHHHPIHLHGYEFALTAQDGHRIPIDKQEMMATVLVPVGRTKDIELVGIYEGDWIFHCHMTHHIMNQMGEFTNTIGMAPGELDAQVQQILPDYMTMGNAGMNDRTGRPAHPIPENSIPMMKGKGPYGFISVSGMANLLKIRADVSEDMLARNEDPGFYESPRETLALPATEADLARDGISV